MLLLTQPQHRTHREHSSSAAVHCFLVDHAENTIPPLQFRGHCLATVLSSLFHGHSPATGVNVTILLIHTDILETYLFQSSYKFLCTILLSLKLLQFQDMNIHGKGDYQQVREVAFKINKKPKPLTKI
jgi:hypothetical protein